MNRDITGKQEKTKKNKKKNTHKKKTVLSMGFKVGEELITIKFIV